MIVLLAWLTFAAMTVATFAVVVGVTTAAVGMAVAVAMPVPVAVRMIMMVSMRRCRIELVRQRSGLWRLLLPSGGIPTITLKMHLRGGDQFLQLRLTAFRAILQLSFTESLQHIKSMAAGLTLIIINRHGYLLKRD